jgi:streptogramin lyase
MTAVVVLLASVQLSGRVLARQIKPDGPPISSQPSFLFRFDSSAQTFYTLTLPLGSMPNSVAVSGVNPSHVWVTEPGRDQIGHLVYTNTDDIAWIEYPITTTNGSGPFRLVVDGNYVWFTERGANRIGRLDTTSDRLDEFYEHGLSPNAGLADIKIAPDGAVWTTGQWSNRLVALTITSTSDYAFHEYTHTVLMGPSGLAIGKSDSIWVGVSGAPRIVEFILSAGRIIYDPLLGFPTDGAPADLIYFFIDVRWPYSEVWFPDLQHNDVGRLLLGKLSVIDYFGPITCPVGLASESANVFWVTQQDARGAIGRLTFTGVFSPQIDSYPLPTSGLRPTGIAVAPDRGVWLTAYMPLRAYLPIILQD